MRFATISAALVATFGLAATAPAHAGGVGLLTNAGVHTERAYYYRSDGLQGVDSQIRPNFGYGGEFLLGDRDDKVQGLMKMWVNNDAAPNEPDVSNEDPGYDYTWPAASEQGPEQVGVITMGVQWGLLGDPTGLQLIGTSLIGTGFATVDNLEYGIGEIGVGGTYTISDRYQIAATVAGEVRYRKQFSFAQVNHLSFRYMFD